MKESATRIFIGVVVGLTGLGLLAGLCGGAA